MAPILLPDVEAEVNTTRVTNWLKGGEEKMNLEEPQS